MRGRCGGGSGTRWAKRAAHQASSEERRRVREQFLRDMRQLHGEVGPEAPPVRHLPPNDVTCCAQATFNASGCACGGTITCPVHSPTGRCSMLYSHD